MKPHKHAELIKAWADGAEIEHRCLTEPFFEHWHEFDGCWEGEDWEYRIKPEPKPEPKKVTMYIYNNAHTGATWIDNVHPKQRVESVYSIYMGSIEVLK